MNALTTAPNTVLDDLHWLLMRTADHAEQARIDALIGAVQAYQDDEGYELGSSYTIGFMTVLEQERLRQRGATA